jgi:hypothetical protein
MHCRIRIKGHLDPGWQEWLAGLQIVHEPDGTSLLLGPLPDQPALLGVLVKLSHLGVPLLSLDSDGTTRTEG